MISSSFVTYWFPNSDDMKRNPDFSTHMLAATGTVSKYFSMISVTYIYMKKLFKYVYKRIHVQQMNVKSSIHYNFI